MFFFSISKIIAACIAATTCTGQGTCGVDGMCQCDSGLTGADCSQGKSILNINSWQLLKCKTQMV